MKTVVFSENGPDRLRLDVYTPENGVPAVSTFVYFHGGGLTGGRRDDPEVVSLANELTKRGIAVVSADYRLYPGAAFPDFIGDAAEAVRWTLDNAEAYRLPKRVFIGGSSAGGYLSMMLCFARVYLANVGLSPEAAAGYIFDAGQPTAHFEVLARQGIDPRRIVVDEGAPLHFVRDARPGKPLLLFCARNDIPGRLAQNQVLISTLGMMGYPDTLIEHHVIEGCGHYEYVDPKNREGNERYIDLCARFLTAPEK